MCETMQIAINSVINWSFFYYICCFSIFPSNFIDSESDVTIRNQLRIRRLDTWRHRARDHSTRHRRVEWSRIGDWWSPTHWWSFGTKPLSPAVFEILASKYIGVTTLTFQGHVTSSVTWPFDSQAPISYRYSIVTKSLSPVIFQILAFKCFRVTTGHDLDLSGSRDVIGHVTIWFPGTHFPFSPRFL